MLPKFTCLCSVWALKWNLPHSPICDKCCPESSLLVVIPIQRNFYESVKKISQEIPLMCRNYNPGIHNHTYQVFSLETVNIWWFAWGTWDNSLCVGFMIQWDRQTTLMQQTLFVLLCLPSDCLECFMSGMDGWNRVYQCPPDVLDSQGSKLLF